MYAETSVCSQCGSFVEADAAFCDQCGARIGGAGSFGGTASSVSSPAHAASVYPVAPAVAQRSRASSGAQAHIRKGAVMAACVLAAVLVVLVAVLAYSFLFGKGDSSDKNANGQMPDAVEQGVAAGQDDRTVTFTVFGGCMTWREAEAYCEEQGGTLACIETKEEYESVLKMAKESGYGVLWLGAARTEGELSWLSGKPIEFEAWAKGEPNAGAHDENFVAMVDDGGVWLWHDFSNDISKEYPKDSIGFVMETRKG